MRGIEKRLLPLFSILPTLVKRYLFVGILFNLCMMTVVLDPSKVKSGQICGSNGRTAGEVRLSSLRNPRLTFLISFSCLSFSIYGQIGCLVPLGRYHSSFRSPLIFPQPDPSASLKFSSSCNVSSSSRSPSPILSVSDSPANRMKLFQVFIAPGTVSLRPLK